MARVPITAASTAAGLHDTLAELAASMVGPAIEDLASGRATPQPQPQEGVTYARKIDKSEARLDWTRPAAFLERQLRALNPWPGCWTEIGGQRLLVLEGEVTADSGFPGEVLDHRFTVAGGEGALRLTTLQRAGGKPIAADAFLRGFHLPVGARLGTPCPATS
jgi:methionyl-tRNA formyltransferase